MTKTDTPTSTESDLPFSAWADQVADAAAAAMLTRCVAVVEALHDYGAPTDAHKDALWKALSALRALKEKP